MNCLESTFSSVRPCFPPRSDKKHHDKLSTSTLIHSVWNDILRSRAAKNHGKH